jgi:hypothetical protein
VRQVFALSQVCRSIDSGRVRFLQKTFGMATLAAELVAALGDRPGHR